MPNKLNLLARKYPRLPMLAAGIALLAWAVIVLGTASQHEFWRDEVRALSVAQSAASPFDLFNAIHNEGHPILWYLLLYVGNAILPNSPLLLPGLAFGIAFVAAAIFMFKSPLPFWLKCLFLFGVLAVYEYSVMARNYGISMMLFFIAAALYKDKTKHALALSIVLALLANTNTHSAILVCLMLPVWAWDAIAERRKTGQSWLPGWRFGLAVVIVIAGVALSIASVLPDDTSILPNYLRQSGGLMGAIEKASSFGKPGAGPILPGVNPYSPDLFNALGGVFSELMPAQVPAWLIAALFFMAILGLIRRPPLFFAGLIGFIGLFVFFQAVYNGHLRHQGLFLVFLLFLYWVQMDSSPAQNTNLPARVAHGIGLIGLMGLLVGGVALGYQAVVQDQTAQMSSNKAFGAFINSSEAYRDAIVIPEPDYALESLPYYAPIQLYFPREKRFGAYVSFTTASSPIMSMSDLLETALELKAKYNKPVLIALGHANVGPRLAGTVRFSYRSSFSWSSLDIAELDKIATPVGQFNSAVGDENYRVYALKP
jgi:hypothetical protein